MNSEKTLPSITRHPPDTSLHPYAVVLSIFVAVSVYLALAAPEIFVRELSYFRDDDFLFLAELRGHDVIVGTPTNVYRFANGNPDDTLRAVYEGRLPWWTAADFKAQFFRPLSTLVIRWAHAAFGLDPRGYRAVHAALIVLAIVLAGFLYWRHLPAPIAWIATAAFGVSVPLMALSSWMATVHLTLALILTLVSLLGYLEYRAHGKSYGLAIALIAISLGVFVSEAIIEAIVLLVAYELVGACRASWRSRMRHAGAFLGIGIAYIVCHRLAEMGAAASGVVLDVLDPTVLPAVLERLYGELKKAFILSPALISEQTFVADIAIWTLTIIVLGGAYGTRRALPVEQWRFVAFMAFAALCTTLPTLGDINVFRTTVFPRLAASAVIATAIWFFWCAVRNTNYRWRTRAASTAALVLICLVGLVGQVAESAYHSSMSRDYFLKVQRFIDQNALFRDDSEPVLLTVPEGHYLAPWAIAVGAVYTGVMRPFWPLSGERGRHRYHRKDERTLELTVESTAGWPLLTAFRGACNDANPVRFFARTRLADIEAVCGRGTLRWARFKFHDSIESTRFHFFTRDSDHYNPVVHAVSPPAIGETLLFD